MTDPFVSVTFYILKRMTTFAEVPEGMDGRFAPLLETARTRQLEQGKMEVARQMKKMGLSIAQIVQASGLPEDVVEGL